MMDLSQKPNEEKATITPPAAAVKPSSSSRPSSPTPSLAVLGAEARMRNRPPFQQQQQYQQQQQQQQQLYQQQQQQQQTVNPFLFPTNPYMFMPPNSMMVRKKAQKVILFILIIYMHT